MRSYRTATSILAHDQRHRIRELYKQFAMENPQQASKVALETIQDIDEKLSKHSIDLLKQ